MNEAQCAQGFLLLVLVLVLVAVLLLLLVLVVTVLVQNLRIQALPANAVPPSLGEGLIQLFLPYQYQAHRIGSFVVPRPAPA